MDTEMLEIGDSFAPSQMAEMASQVAKVLEGETVVEGEHRETLKILNAGLFNFLTGEYSAIEPEPKSLYEGEEIVEDWQEFANEIAYGYTRLEQSGYTAFYREETAPDVLKSKAEDEGTLESIPSYIMDAVDWQRVSAFVLSSGGVEEMQLDGEVYLTNLELPGM